MFSLLNKQHRQQASVEHKQAPHSDEQAHNTTNNKPTKRKARSAASTSGSTLTSHSSTSLAPLPSASTYINEHPQRVARINFHRLLSRVEKQIQAANSAGGEHKEALTSVREQTLVRKVSHRHIRSQCSRHVAPPSLQSPLTRIHLLSCVLSVAGESSVAA